MTSDRDMQAVKSEYLVYPAGRYQQYENKIQKAAKIVKFVRRHRIAFAAALLALAAVFFCLTYCMGIFTQDNSCSVFQTNNSVALAGYHELDCPRLIAPQSEIVPTLRTYGSTGGRVVVRIELFGCKIIPA